jgi:hypothetical protein
MKINTTKYPYQVRVQYAYGTHKSGDILSQHETHAAAQKAARGNTFVAVRCVSDYHPTP